MGKKWTLERFLEGAKEKHGDKYDYSEVDFKTSQHKVKIICPLHGEFEQYPADHAKRGSECFQCGHATMGKKRRLTFEQFVEKAEALHGDQYSYEMVEYKSHKEPIKVVCKDHGQFTTKPGNLFLYTVCPDCLKLKQKQMNLKDTEYFIEKAREVHGDKYDYSEVEYTHTETPVLIMCPEHGEFWQRPHSHSMGQGCNSCGYEVSGVKGRVGLEKFVARSVEIHGDKYDYSKTEYKTTKDRVEIVCTEHGPFWQTAGKHMFGQEGCKQCLEDKVGGFVSRIYKTDQPSNLYLVRISCATGEEEFFKVGLSITPETRWRQVENESGYQVSEITTYQGPAKTLFKCEQIAFVANKEFKYTPKTWFGGMTECFKMEHLETVQNFIEDYLLSKEIPIAA